MIKGILQILSEQEKSKGIKVLVASLFSAILDFAGIAALLPLIIKVLNGSGYNRQVLILSFAVLIIIVAKHLFIRYLSLYRSTFLLSVYKRLSKELYIGFYKKGLLYIKEKGVSQLVHRVNYNCYIFSVGVVGAIFTMLADLILLLLISIFVLIYNPTIALILLLCVTPLVFIYLFYIRKRLYEWGKMEEKSRREQTKIVSETYRGFSDLQMNQAYGVYEKSFILGVDTISKSRIKVEQLSLLPACLSEIAIVVALILLLVLNPQNASLLVGLFSVAAFRLIPALRQVLTSWGRIGNLSFCIPIILEALSSDSQKEDTGTIQATLEDKIEIKNLSYTYPTGECGVKDMNAVICKGEYVGIRGASGKGKTTFFNILMRLIDSYKGSISIDSVELKEINKESWHRLIGYVSQDVYIFSGTLAENIAFGCEKIDFNKVKDIIKRVQLENLVLTRGGDINFTVAEEGKQLSGGEKQRIAIARALYKGAKLLLLDEATSSLDNYTEQEILSTINTLRAQDKELTIISIAHRESSLAECDRIIDIC
ncbi:MAG: ABC transporter ATP-binding protein [Bacteroidia bacterium]|nr:ABC transporter ATP-binding protein [Bacteroidia bacterium]